MKIFRSKYNNKKIKTSEGTFDSIKEYNRWCDLKLMQRAGLITGLARQQRFEVIPKQRYEGKTILPAYYIADFVYIRNGKMVVEDCKGFKTDVYKLKKKLMLLRYGVMIEET